MYFIIKRKFYFFCVSFIEQHEYFNIYRFHLYHIYFYILRTIHKSAFRDFSERKSTYIFMLCHIARRNFYFFVNSRARANEICGRRFLVSKYFLQSLNIYRGPVIYSLTTRSRLCKSPPKFCTNRKTAYSEQAVCLAPESSRFSESALRICYQQPAAEEQARLYQSVHNPRRSWVLTA
jgi:hypothetical protein